MDLLFPSTFTEMGITEFDFQVPRARGEIRVLFERIGFIYKIGKFNAIYNRAKDIMVSQSGGTLDDDRVSVRAFLFAVKEMHAIE